MTAGKAAPESMPESARKTVEASETTFKKKPNESAAQYIVRSIQDAIRKGDLKIGDMLPSEMELAEKLGVGRSSIREGIRILTTFGILEVKQGKGTYVVDHFVESLFNMLGFSLVGDNLGYFLAARRVLECGCMEMVDPAALTQKDLNELEALANALSPNNALKDNIVFDRMFHNKLVNLTDNKMMIRIYNMVESLLWELMENLMCYEDVVVQAHKSHLYIVDALRKQDRRALVRAMSEHLGAVEDYSRERLSVDVGAQQKQRFHAPTEN